MENVSGTLTGTLAGGQLERIGAGFHAAPGQGVSRAVALPRGPHARCSWSLDDRAFTLGSHLMRVEGGRSSLAGDMLIRLMRDPGAEDYMDLQVGLSDGDARSPPSTCRPSCRE
ncbi:hypothetical protein ACPA9J_29470 [Pseudomonas aeruginosa]